MNILKVYLYPLSLITALYLFFKYYSAAKLEARRTGNPVKLVYESITDNYFKQNKLRIQVYKLIYDMCMVTISIFISTGLIYSATTKLHLFVGTLFLIPILVLFKAYS